MRPKRFSETQAQNPAPKNYRGASTHELLGKPTHVPRSSRDPRLVAAHSTRALTLVASGKHLLGIIGSSIHRERVCFVIKFAPKLDLEDLFAALELKPLEIRVLAIPIQRPGPNAPPAPSSQGSIRWLVDWITATRKNRYSDQN